MLLHWAVELHREFLDLQRDKRAVTTIEYGLVAALIAITIINSVFQVGHNIANTFSRISSEL